MSTKRGSEVNGIKANIKQQKKWCLKANGVSKGLLTLVI